MTFKPHHPMIIDSFSGDIGASTGIEMALGRSPDVAINHSAKALALRGIVALRKKDKDQVAEEETLLELYKQALNMA